MAMPCLLIYSVESACLASQCMVASSCPVSLLYNLHTQLFPLIYTGARSSAIMS